MQQIYAYLDMGDGLQPVNNAEQDIAMLADLSIQWGTDSPDTQPDPGVCDFTLRDRTGDLAGDFIRLSGARLVLRINESPTWADMGPFASYEDCRFPWKRLSARWRPPVEGGRTNMIFDGIITTGGTIHWDRRGWWLITLSATSRMVMWKRLATKGPTNGDSRAPGMHWVGSPQQRLDWLNQRAADAGAPTVDTTGLTLPASVAPYDADTYPTQLELLHRLFAHSPRMPIWHEDVSGETPSIGHTDLAAPSGIILDAEVNTHTIDSTGSTRPAIPSSVVGTDEDITLTMLEPWTQTVITGKSVSVDDGKLAVEETETTTTADNLPGPVKAAQKSISLDSDAVLTSTASGYNETAISDADRQQVRDWLTSLDTRTVPETVIFDSRFINPYDMPWLFRCQPSGPIFVSGTLFANLVDADGSPSSSGVWTTIGGTLTYEWLDDEPVIRNECTVAPLPRQTTNRPKWGDLEGWPAKWYMVNLTWAQTKLVNQYTPQPAEGEQS